LASQVLQRTWGRAGLHGFLGFKLKHRIASRVDAMGCAESTSRLSSGVAVSAPTSDIEIAGWTGNL
jgi:hypothetical protein